MDLFNIDRMVYLISNLFRIYVVFRFINIFFDRTYVNNKVEKSAFAVYFILNSIIYLFFKEPIINLSSNILLFFILTFIYNAKLSTRLIATVLIYAVNMLLDGMVHSFFTQMDMLININIITGIISNLFLYVFVLFFEKAFITKDRYKMNLVHWITIFIIPVGSIFIATTLLLSNYKLITNVISVYFLLVINIVIFYVYDMLIKFYDEKYEKELLKQQNNSYINQFEIIKQSQSNIRILRHDIKNHIYKIKYMTERDKKEDILNYLNSALNFIEVSQEYVTSENTDVDSILNYKIHEAKKIRAKVEVNINIPEKLKIESFDLNVILGNLMDNAIYAIKQSKKKDLKIEIELDRGILYITIVNDYAEEVVIKDGKFQTTKKDAENHGIGLSSVENIIKKYNGTIEIDHNNGKFTVNILLYNLVEKI